MKKVMPKEVKAQLVELNKDGFHIIPHDQPDKGIWGFMAFKKDEEDQNFYWDMYGRPFKTEVVSPKTFDDVLSFWNDHKDDVLPWHIPRKRIIGMIYPDLENDVVKFMQWSLVEHKGWQQDFTNSEFDDFLMVHEEKEGTAIGMPQQGKRETLWQCCYVEE